jgi:glycosyltransferase involved in cell wall biosynthesis
MKKIIIDGRLLSKKNTGISRYTEEVINSYISIYGSDSIFVIVNDPTWKIRYNTILTQYKPYNIVHFVLFSFFIKKYNFDILHSISYSGLFRKLKYSKNIVTVHDLMYRIIPNYFSNNRLINVLAIFYYDFIVKVSLRNANFIISVSGTTKEDTLKFFRRESFVIPEGINLDKLTTIKETDEIRKFPIDTNKFFLYVGNLRKQKNIDFLIRTFLKSKTEYDLVICGNYHEVPKKWKNLKNVLFLGYLSDDVLKDLYRGCKAFVFPSLYEGFGLPILEALSNGALVLSSSGGALSEFKCKGIYHFDPLNDLELKTLIETVDSLEFDGEDVKKFLSYYSWEKSLSFMHEILNVNLIS